MLFNVIVVSSLLLIVTVLATPTGNHTCTGVVKHPVTVRVNVTEPVKYRTYTWCLRVPPRCSKYTTQLKDRVKIHTEMHNRTITVCCKGYVEMDYKCVPACPPQTECPNMHCNRTNHCYCTPGYQGLYCNYPCDRGFWGTDCKKPCDCPDGYTCHHLTGDCMIDDRPAFTTKYRRTTTTTVATISPETTITQSTTTTTTPELTTESPTQSDFSTTKEMKNTTAQSQTTAHSTLLPTTVSSVATNVPTFEPAVQTEMFTTNSHQTSRFHFSKEFPLTQMTSSTYNTNTHRSKTLEQFPITDDAVTSSITPLFTKQSILTNSPTSLETTTKLPLQRKITTVTATTVSEEAISQNTLSTLRSPVEMDRTPSIVVQNVSEASLSTSTAMYTTPVPLSTVILLSSIPSMDSKEPSSSTIFTTSSTVPTTISTVFTKPSTTAGPISISPMEDTTVESTPIYKSNLSPMSTKTLSGNETNTTSTPLSTETFTNSTDVNNATSFKSTISPGEISSDDKSILDFNKDIFQTSAPTTQKDNDNITMHVKIGVSISEKTLLATTTTGNVTETTGPVNIPTTERLSDIQSHREPVKTTMIPTITTGVINSYMVTTSEPLTKYTQKKYFNEENTFNDSTTYTRNFGEEEKQKENIFNFPKTETTPKIDKIDSSSVANLETDSNITPTTSKPDFFSKTTELAETTAFEPVHPLTYAEDKLQIEIVTNEKSEDLVAITTEKNFIITTSDSIPVLEAAGNEQVDHLDKVDNIMRKSYKNGTNLISGINEVSTKFGQPIFELGKSVSEMKLKQRTEATTTLTTKVYPSTKNLLITTNSRPAHTWYSHIRDFQKKVKNKEDIKLLKTTSNLESFVVTERDDMSEESNIIDSMHTTYIERGYKGNSGPPPMVNEEANIPSTYLQNGQINYNLSSALAEGVQAGRKDKSFFSLYSTSTLISGISLILVIITSITLWLCHRRKKEPTTLRGPCIMAYGPPSEFTLNPLMYETVYPLDPLEEDQCVDPEIFFCPTFTNNYAEKINRELSELNYDHPRSSICEPLYAEIRY